jgi:replicative DNA helicase
VERLIMHELKLPPQSAIAEQNIIGSILINNGCLNSVLELVTGEHFYNQTNQQIFTCIKELASRNTAIDITTLGDYLEKKFQTDQHFAYLVQMAKDTPSSANVIAYCSMVVNHWNGRKIIEACHKALDRTYDTAEYEAARLDLYSDLENLFKNKGEELIHDGPALAESFIAEMERLVKADGEMSGMSTGDEHIDQVSGGLHPGDYIGIAAKSGGGKTTKAINIMTHFAKMGRRVLFFSTEMKRQKVMMKICADLGNVPFAAIKKADMNAEQWNNVTEAAQVIKKSKMHVDDSSGLTIDDIERKARQIKAKYGDLDLICFDYIQRIKISGGGSMYQELTNASNRLKDLFMELGCAGIVLAQLKKNTKGRPTASDLRETGAIENDSDLLIFLHTDSEDSKPQKGMFTHEIFNKVRFGETGVKMLTNQLDYQRFICNDEKAPEPKTETEWG